MTDSQIAWLAGLLEGEGSFMKPAPSSPNQPIVAVHMTDEDVIAKVAALWGVRYQAVRRTNTRWKQSFAVRVRGRKARETMTAVRPHMSTRRTAQIDAALAVWEPYAWRRLTFAVAEEIRRQRAATVPVVELAEQHGVTKWMIYAILQNRCYTTDRAVG